MDFQELFAYPDAHPGRPGRAGARRRGRRHDLHQLEDDLFDLEPVLRDAVVLALPLQPVCRDDCPGLCSECGVRLADDPDHHHDAADPRWAALQELTRDRRPSDGATETHRRGPGRE